VPLFPLIVVREKLARGDRPRDPEPMVMDEPQAVAEYDQIGASVQVAAHQFSALGISRLLPNGGTLIDLGCGSARLPARLAYGRPDARLIGLAEHDQTDLPEHLEVGVVAVVAVVDARPPGV
jgi:arsenite methyltransferase